MRYLLALVPMKIRKILSPSTSVSNWAIKLVFFLVSFSACSLSSRQPNPELARTLAIVSADYLRYVISVDEKKLGNVVLWTDILKTKGLEKTQYLRKAKSLKLRYGLRPDHPLLGLRVMSIRIDDDRAWVELKKDGQTDAPTIEISLVWGSVGWLVLNDNLFGEGELIDFWTSNN